MPVQSISLRAERVSGSTVRTLGDSERCTSAGAVADPGNPCNKCHGVTRALVRGCPKFGTPWRARFTVGCGRCAAVPFTSRVAQVGMLQPTNSSRRCRSWSPVEHTNTCPSPAANPTTSPPLHENKGVIACGEMCQALGLPCCPRHQLAACVRVSSLAGRACRVGLELKHKVNRQLGWTWLTVGQAAGRSVMGQTETGKPDGYSRSMEQSS